MRPSRDAYLMEMAQVVARRGTCPRLQVGCVVARSGRVLVTGYNGAPSGMDHCEHLCTCNPHRLEGDAKPLVLIHAQDCGSRQPCEVSVHAECNAVAYAARWGISLQDSEMFTTASPCLYCAQLVINSGIERVVYNAEFRDTRGMSLLREAGLRCETFLLLPAGPSAYSRREE